MAESQILALSGKSRGVLRLEYGEELAFSLVSPAYLKDAELWLIFSDGEYQVLEGCQGRCPLPPRRVRAAAVARQGTFLMTGGHADFGAARSACFTRHEKKRLKALEVQAQPEVLPQQRSGQLQESQGSRARKPRDGRKKEKGRKKIREGQARKSSPQKRRPMGRSRCRSSGRKRALPPARVRRSLRLCRQRKCPVKVGKGLRAGQRSRGSAKAEGRKLLQSLGQLLHLLPKEPSSLRWRSSGNPLLLIRKKGKKRARNHSGLAWRALKKERPLFFPSPKFFHPPSG